MAETENRDYVTVVSGLPRSGTSMMMQMLAAGGLPVLTDQQRHADEDNPRGYYELEAVKQVSEDASWLRGAEGKAVKMVYRLLYDLPSDHRYRVVFMLRELDEVIASQEAMLQRLGQRSGEIDPKRLEDIFRRQLDQAKGWLAAQPNFKALYVQYRDVLGQPEEVAQKLNRFLDDRLNVEAMARVPDQSLYRQRRASETLR